MVSELTSRSATAAGLSDLALPELRLPVPAEEGVRVLLHDALRLLGGNGLCVSALGYSRRGKPLVVYGKFACFPGRQPIPRGKSFRYDHS